MAREIKFREWDPNRQKIYGSGGLSYGVREDYDDSVAFGFAHTERIDGDLSKERVLEQYTGLKDKNGVEIYENDIIEISDMSYGDSDKHYGVVKYSEYAELVVGNILLSRVYKAIKVIGNIHENPKLLEE